MNMDLNNIPLASYKIVFFGSLSVMSYATLLPLLQRKIPIAAVVIPGIKPEDTIAGHLGDIPVVQPPKHDTVELLALEYNIPIVYIRRLDDLESYSQISKFEPHFIWVACFPYILPEKIWRLARIASINLHPSYATLGKYSQIPASKPRAWVALICTVRCCPSTGARIRCSGNSNRVNPAWALPCI